MPAFRSRSIPRGPALVPAIAAAAAMALGAGASAQQPYILTDHDQWAPQRQIDPSSPEGQLHEARKALAENDHERAETLASSWIERFPQHPLMPDAYLIRGDARTASGNEYQALFDYEYIAKVYPASENFVAALQRELAIAKQYAAGKRRKQWGLRIWDATSEAEELLIRIQERLPGSKLGEEAGMELADFYFRRRQMELAAIAYELFIENYPRSPLIDKARRRLVYSHLATFKGPEFGATGLYEARERLRQLRTTRPAEAERMGADALLTRIDESDAQKMLAVAQHYLRAGEPVSAEFTIRRLVQRYPRSVAAAEALRSVPGVLERLPARLREQAPDYAAMAEALLNDAGRTQPREHDDAAAEPAAPAPPETGR